MFIQNKIITKLCYFFYILIPIVCNCNVNLILEGLNLDLEYNVRKYLSKIDCNIKYINKDFKAQLSNAIIFALKPFGYYNPTINFFINLKNSKNVDFYTLIIKIDPGEAVKISSVNINISGEAKHDSDYQKLIKYSKYFVGKQLYHSDYEQLKSKLYNLAIYKGYFDAKIQNSQLIVIPSKHQCIWNINLDSGKRYIFEDIKFQGSQINSSYLKNICNIRLGEYYHAESIIELNKRLSSTNWFESIFTSPTFIKCSQKKNNIKCFFVS